MLCAQSFRREIEICAGKPVIVLHGDLYYVDSFPPAAGRSSADAVTCSTLCGSVAIGVLGPLANQRASLTGPWRCSFFQMTPSGQYLPRMQRTKKKPATSPNSITTKATSHYQPHSRPHEVSARRITTEHGNYLFFKRPVHSSSALSRLDAGRQLIRRLEDFL